MVTSQWDSLSERVCLFLLVSADEHFNEELKQCLARSRTARNQNRKEKIVGHQQQPQHKQDSQQQQASGQTGTNEKYPTSGTSVASESEQKSVSFGEERRGLYQRHRINSMFTLTIIFRRFLLFPLLFFN